MKKTILFLFVISIGLASAQQRISGLITDKTEFPIMGAKIVVKNSELYTYSDEAGKYSIIVPKGFKTILFTKESFRGHEATIIDSVMNIVLLSYDEINSSELSMDELMNVVTTSSSKVGQTAFEAPGVVSMTTQEEIGNYGWTSINDILYKQAGFSPSQDYDRKTVASRGLFEGWNNNHLLFTIDDIPFNDNLYGSAYTSEITPLIFAKNIEILRGPGSALYGSNATNGVIQINSLSPEDLKGNGYWQIRLGNDGVRNYNFLAGSKLKNFSYMIAFNNYNTNGNEYFTYDGSGRVDANNNLLKFKTNDRQKSSYLWIKLRGENQFSDLSFQYHYQNWSYQTGPGWLWYIADYNESMNEDRHIFALTYTPKISEKINSEFMIRYQRHDIDWNMRFYPNETPGYPAGMWEYLNTKAEDIFARAQIIYSLPMGASFLTGVESDIFYYDGDNEHYSNVDVDNTFLPFDSTNKFVKLGPWLDWIKGNPVKSFGIYGQFMSGSLFCENLKLTLGARYDNEFFNYNEIYIDGRPKKSKDFSQFSPRLALVYIVNDKLSFKALAGKAFRAPSPTEMFGAHTYSLASNIEQLKPEIITTYEAAMIWSAFDFLNLRINFFNTNFENQIAYSLANNNLSSNIYSLTNRGIETEFLFHYKELNGFLNFSYTKRVNEDIQDQTITTSSDLTWETPFKVNFGATYSKNGFETSLLGHYSAKVNRRSSDMGANDEYRGSDVGDWFSLDFNTGCQVTNYLEAGITVSNLLDKEYFLVKNMNFPFDYKQMGRTYLINVKISF